MLAVIRCLRCGGEYDLLDRTCPLCRARREARIGFVVEAGVAVLLLLAAVGLVRVLSLVL